MITSPTRVDWSHQIIEGPNPLGAEKQGGVEELGDPGPPRDPLRPHPPSTRSWQALYSDEMRRNEHRLLMNAAKEASNV